MVWLRHRPRHIAVYRVNAAQREEAAGERYHQLLDCGTAASHDAFFGGIYDQQYQVETFQRFSNRGRGTVHDAEGPFDRFPGWEFPQLPCRPACAGKIMGKEGRFVHPLQHQVPVAPGAQGEKPGRFAEAVADYRLRLHAELADDVAHGRAEGNLAKNHRPVIVLHLHLRRLVPEHVRLELLAKEEVLPVLGFVHGRPPGRQLYPHAGEVIARAGVDECHLACRSHRLGRIEHTVADRRGKGCISSPQPLCRLVSQGATGKPDLLQQFGPVPRHQGQSQCMRPVGMVLAEPITGKEFNVVFLTGRNDRLQMGSTREYVLRRRAGQHEKRFVAGAERPINSFGHT